MFHQNPKSISSLVLNKYLICIEINNWSTLFRRDDRSQDPRGCYNAFQRHSGIHVNLFDGHADDGDKYAAESLQSVWRLLWTDWCI